MLKRLKPLLFLGVLVAFLIVTQKAKAGMKIYSNLDCRVHLVSILKDEALAYTYIDKPSCDVNNCASITKLWALGAYDTSWRIDEYREEGNTWDLPLNAGAKVKTRRLTDAMSEHWAKSYNTGYGYIRGEDCSWSR